jgi:hypothetical protein
VRLALAILANSAFAFFQSAPVPVPDLKSVHRIFIDKLPNDLDQYLRAEFSKQMKGKVVVVLDEKDADGDHDRRQRRGKRNRG